ncbi:hypothetical protein THRCLA_03929 [Thraustotheca clavata]|uniref:Myb-like domain-containing protein n=1 Tax=Thraustotheca clavata TaxID=74557 RepID=A0A1W0A185_9STRA|nr:hypothetical protein THRCLA_03929 [Thraustotheca clavata]
MRGLDGKAKDALNWDAPLIPLEDGWLDKMDSTLAGTADSFFHDLSWSDSADSLLSSPALTSRQSTRLSISESLDKFIQENDDLTSLALPGTHEDATEVRNLGHFSSFFADTKEVLCESIATVESPLSVSNTEEDNQWRMWNGWQWNEQRAFFRAIKAKWSEKNELIERWTKLSKKVGTKTKEEFEKFYICIVDNVSDLLKVGKVTMDLNAPEEVRFALLSWYRLVATSTKMDLDNPSEKLSIAHRLTTSFLKSCKQLAVSRLEKRNSKEDSSEASLQCVHHPLVRKKRQLLASSTPQKRARPSVVAAPDDQIISPLSSPNNRRPATTTTPSVTIPDNTPSKKRQIKVRLVPIDKRTQAVVSRTGAMPKVELKMSCTKRISDVCDHMTKKWAAVVPFLPPCTVLRVVPLGDRLHPGWGTHDISVTCLDIFNHCQRQAQNTLVDTVTLEYRWEVEANENTPAFANEFTTPQRQKQITPSSISAQKPIPVPADLEFLRSPHETPSKFDPTITLNFSTPHETPSKDDPTTTLNFSTDFNGFLDEGPNACSAVMESLCTNTTPKPEDNQRKPLKRITPTLISTSSPLIRLDTLPPPLV